MLRQIHKHREIHSLHPLLTKHSRSHQTSEIFLHQTCPSEATARVLRPPHLLRTFKDWSMVINYIAFITQHHWLNIVLINFICGLYYLGFMLFRCFSVTARWIIEHIILIQKIVQTMITIPNKPSWHRNTHIDFLANAQGITDSSDRKEILQECHWLLMWQTLFCRTSES